MLNGGCFLSSLASSAHVNRFNFPQGGAISAVGGIRPCIFGGCSRPRYPKKPLDHDSYDLWNTISRQVMSDDGQWVMYSVQNGAIDGHTTHLFILRVVSGTS